MYKWIIRLAFILTDSSYLPTCQRLTAGHACGLKPLLLSTSGRQLSRGGGSQRHGRRRPQAPKENKQRSLSGRAHGVGRVKSLDGGTYGTSSQSGGSRLCECEVLFHSTRVNAFGPPIVLAYHRVNVDLQLDCSNLVWLCW